MRLKIMANRLGILRVLVAVLVLLVGSILVGDVPAVAQASDYTINWQATDLIVARLKKPNYAHNQAECTTWRLDPLGTPIDSEVAIGVHKWTVRGELPGSARFKEIWSTPALPRAFTYTGDFINGECRNGRLIIDGLAGPNDWLTGYLNVSNLGVSAMEIRTVGVTTEVGHHNLDPGSVRNIGNTTSCQASGGDTDRCTYTTGAYSWLTLHRFQSGMDKKHMNLGTMIPLKWSVSGTFCEPGDNRCD
ncbi:MAG: hypothetical protein HZB70_01850 [Candidatus Berkelbacteria bacterium]|nr:MAG: hypothetical protein HZB70_01850 [Candidatus Berkelbacteria bacterium]QQG51933.1 MAG: hypothetical protein HY845_01145 [Candidatus Berkelbacteria bacterium]